MTIFTSLARHNPPSEIFGADPLGYSQLEDGLIVMTSRFEQLVGDDWQEIDDPRIRTHHGLSEYEQEIDAENRRLFPGDYLPEDGEDNSYNIHLKDEDVYDDTFENVCRRCGRIDGDGPPGCPQATELCYLCDRFGKWRWKRRLNKLKVACRQYLKNNRR